MCVTWPNNCYCNCYHFNQEVSPNRPQVSTLFLYNNNGRCCRERRRKRRRKRKREGEEE